MIETFGKEVLKSSGYKPLKFLLLLLSYCFQAGVILRNKLFDFKILSSKKPEGTYIVSVGNITAGGSGKSPLVMQLCKELGFPIALLTRGYRTGDEALMVANRCKNVRPFIDKDRFHSATIAKKEGYSFMVCDDAMQHRYLKKDFEIAMVNGRDPLGLGYFLPRGFLRDELKNLSRCDLIIIHRSGKNLPAVKEKIRKYSQAPLLVTEIKVRNFPLENEKVAAFAAIADPDSFYETVTSLGSIIVDRLSLTDHAPLSFDLLDRFALQSAEKGAKYLVCTEKDAVKLDREIKLKLPVVVVEIELQFVEGELEWKQVIEEMRENYEALG